MVAAQLRFTHHPISYRRYAKRCAHYAAHCITSICEPVLRRRKRNIDWEVPHTRDSEFAFHDVGLVYLTDEIVLNHKQPIKLVPAMILALTQETEQARDRSISAFKGRDSLAETVIKSHI